MTLASFRLRLALQSSFLKGALLVVIAYLAGCILLVMIA